MAFYIYSFNSKVSCCFSAVGCSLSLPVNMPPLWDRRIVWLHGTGQNLPTYLFISHISSCNSCWPMWTLRVKNILAAQIVLWMCRWKRDQEPLKGSLWLTCVRGKCDTLSGPCQSQQVWKCFSIKKCPRPSTESEVNLHQRNNATFAFQVEITFLSVTDMVGT